MNRKLLPIMAALAGALTLAGCGGNAAPSSAPASPSSAAASPAASKPAAASASAKPAASTAASAKPAASTAASAKPAASGAASAKPAASGSAGASAKPEAAAPPAAARTPVVEVAKVPPGPSTPAVAALASVPASSRPPLASKYSQSVGPYSLYMESIASAAPSTSGLLAVPGCVDSSVFKRGMRVVFRYSLYDTGSGKPLTDRDGASTKVQVPNQALEGYFAPRGAPPPPPNAPWTWVAVWNVPPDLPLGNVTPTIQVTTKDGKSTTVNPADFAALPLQIVD